MSGAHITLPLLFRLLEVNCPLYGTSWMVACGHVSLRESPASVARTPSGGDPASGTHPQPRATRRPPAAIGQKDPTQDVRLAMNRWRPDLRDEECTMTTSVSKDSPDFHPASSAATATVSQVEALTG